MDEATGDRTAADDAGTPGATSSGPDADPPRTHGLTFETCYRHSTVTTGVHCTRCGRPICPDCMHPAAVGYQCPECLREARQTAPRRRVGVRFYLGRPGSVTTALLITNVVMFVIEVALSGGTALYGSSGARLNETLFDMGAMQPIFIAHGQYWRLISSMFLHANLLHIAFNMWALYLFGYLIEGAFGKVRFIAIYFVAGFLASVTSYAFSDPRSLGVGASGAIFGLLGAWVAYNYRRRRSPLAAAQLRSAMFLVAINLFLGFTIPSIDNFAHIGGLLAGGAAGSLAEGVGPRATRTAVTVGGMAALVLAGIVLAVDRTSTVRALFGA
ncbi:MAG: rhomboid family intramembrane serine protease [Actinomycetota bacterium]